MRFPQAIRIPFLLVAVLATASVVSSLSIPQKLNADLALADLAKRAPPAGGHPPPVKGEAATTAASRATPAASKRPASSPSSQRPNSSPASSESPATSPSAVSSSSTVPPHTSAPASSNSSNVTQLNNSTATQTGSNSTATGVSPGTPVPTGGLSTPALGGIVAVGGVAVIGAAIFAAMRYKRKASLTQNLGTKNINQYSGTSPYGGPAAFPSGANTGYERLSDPQLSGALAPAGAPSPQQQQQQSLGTYTVISTYTPTLGDELEIQPGDKVTLLVEYDDGWCQGINESRGRVKGVFPKHCVDYGNNQGGMEDMEKSKRVSSMYGSGGYRM